MQVEQKNKIELKNKTKTIGSLARVMYSVRKNDQKNHFFLVDSTFLAVPQTQLRDGFRGVVYVSGDGVGCASL